jgi:hypothetical protein
MHNTHDLLSKHQNKTITTCVQKQPKHSPETHEKTHEKQLQTYQHPDKHTCNIRLKKIDETLRTDTLQHTRTIIATCAQYLDLLLQHPYETLESYLRNTETLKIYACNMGEPGTGDFCRRGRSQRRTRTTTTTIASSIGLGLAGQVARNGWERAALDGQERDGRERAMRDGGTTVG